MYGVCGLWLGPNFGVRSASERTFTCGQRLRTCRRSSFLIEKYLWPHGSIGSNFTHAGKCANPKTEVQSEIIER